jgi:hypothetical protein
MGRVRRLPCKLMLATVAFCLAVGDWYPFSTFPMYSVFSRQTWYVSVTDEHDRPLATEPTFGIGAMPLMRLYHTRMYAHRRAGVVEAAVPPRAARDVLTFLIQESRPGHDGVVLPRRLRLWRTTFTLKKTRAERSRELLGELATR